MVWFMTLKPIKSSIILIVKVSFSFLIAMDLIIEK